MKLPLGLLLLLPGLALGAPPAKAPHRPDEVLVRFRTDITLPEARGRMAALPVEPRRKFRLRSRPQSPNNRLFLMTLKNGWTVEKAIEILSRRPDVELVQPNYLHHADAVNDPSFGEQWGFDNTGQAGLRGPLAPTPDADIDWPEARALLGMLPPPAAPIVVAVIDSGIDLNHPDLVDMIWINPGEIPGNGLDDDLNGFADDVQGWDFAFNDNDPTDGDGHGTHVSGTVGAAVDNAVGVAGVASHIEIMPLRFLDDAGAGTTADAIDAINYAIDNGARVLNNSWGGGPFEQLLFDAIQDANLAGAVFVAAAGNDAADTDLVPHYPSSYDLPNILSVANSDRRELLSESSNWGEKSVDLAGPGDEILSTFPGDAYAFLGGTSMAAPHVAGAAAILYAYGFAATPDQVRDDILFATDPRPDHQFLTVSSGRLNLLNLVTRPLGLDTTPPGPIDDLSLVNLGSDFVTLRLTAPGDDGTTGRALRYFVGYDEDAVWTSFDGANIVIGGWVPGPAGSDDYFTIGGLNPATPYRFQVQVLDDGRNATLSNEVVVTTAAIPVPNLFFEDFETGAPGWTTGGTTAARWTLVTDDFHSPVTSVTDSPGGDYPDNAIIDLFSPPIDLTAVTGPVTLSFWQKYDFEPEFDYGLVDVSTDAGSTWDPLLTLTGTDTTWTRMILDLSPFTGSSVTVRFRVQSDFIITADGWRIDDVGVDRPPQTMPVFLDPFDSLAAWTTTPGGDWGLSAGRLSDSPAGDYGLDTIDAVTLAAPLDLSTAGRAFVNFDLGFDYETGYDFLFFEVSTDGLYWRDIAGWNGTRSLAPESVDLTEYAGYPEVRLRFRNSTDFTITAAGAEIDNFRVEVTAMPDADGDGAPDFLDCAPGDASAFAPPAEIQGVLFQADETTMNWSSQAAETGAGIRYDVVRGSLYDLPVGSAGTETCHEMLSVDPQTEDLEVLTPGVARFYLVRGVNGCAVGTYGFQSDLDERLTAACPP